MTLSDTSGIAVTVPPGSLGLWVNGETPSTQRESCSTGPKRLSRTATPTAVHAIAAQPSGTAPKASAAMPIITAAAGICMGVPEEARGSLPEFIEKFAAVLIVAGFPPMSARVFVALLISDSGGLTAAGLADLLQISPAAVSGAVRYLSGLGLVRKERVPGLGGSTTGCRAMSGIR